MKGHISITAEAYDRLAQQVLRTRPRLCLRGELGVMRDRSIVNASIEAAIVAALDQAEADSVPAS